MLQKHWQHTRLQLQRDKDNPPDPKKVFILKEQVFVTCSFFVHIICFFS